MTGYATDPLEWQGHIRNKSRREALARRFRDPADPFRIVIVRDMWLTGFDAPSLHTMYVDKPMHGHGLMQAIARVNRVFRDKPGGLVVDYLGLADELRKALAVVHGERRPRQGGAFAGRGRSRLMRREYEVCRGLFHGFDWSAFSRGSAGERVSVLPRAQEHILAQQATGSSGCSTPSTRCRGRSRWPCRRTRRWRSSTTSPSSRPFAPSCGSRPPGSASATEDLDFAIRQIVSRAVASDEIIDIFAAAGLRKPDISILSDDFLAEVHDMPQKNLAVELLAKLLKGEIKSPLAPQRGRGAFLREDARRGRPPLPEPRHRNRPGHRGADRPGPRHARPRRPRRAARPDRGRAGLLRRPGDQRLRRGRAGRRNPARHRPRAGGHRQGQRHHRLDRPRERPRPPPRPASSAASANTATRRTSKPRPRSPSWSKPRFSPNTGPRHDDGDATVAGFKKELRWNEAYYHLARGLR